MKLDFDVDNIRHAQFGVGRDFSGGQGFNTIAVDQSIQTALRDMAKATIDSLGANCGRANEIRALRTV